MHCSGIVIRNPCYLSRDIAFDNHYFFVEDPRLFLSN